MADKYGSIANECCIAKDVIRMAVGVDDVPDRLVGARPDRREQLTSLADTAAGIDYRNRACADDKPDIGDRAIVLARHQGGFADVHEYSGGDFAHRQVDRLRLR